MTVQYRADVVIAGGGLAGLATAHELLERGMRVLILDRDSEDRLGGLAKRSFGGVMFVDTPHQRKLGLRDTPDRCGLARENPTFPCSVHELLYGLGSRTTPRALFTIRHDIVFVFSIRHVAQRDVSPDDL